MNIVICGVKSSGKSTVGSYIASKMDYDFIDTDISLAQYFNTKNNTDLDIPSIFKMVGRSLFTELEREVITKIYPSSPTVISLGGSSLLDESVARHCKCLGVILHCQISFDEFICRIRKLEPSSFIGKLSHSELLDYFNSRHEYYQMVSDYVFSNY